MAKFWLVTCTVVVTSSLAHAGDDHTFSLALEKANAHGALNLLAHYCGQNIVVSDAVDATVTERMKRATTDRAIESVVQAAGAASVRLFDVVVVGPTEKIGAWSKKRARMKPLRFKGAKKVSIDLYQADLLNMLRLLSAISGKTMRVTPEVGGKVSVKVRNLPWDRTLAVVLLASGLGAVDQNGIIHVGTLEQLGGRKTDGVGFGALGDPPPREDDAEPRDRYSTPLERFTLAELTLRGLIVDTERPMAMFTDPSGLPQVARAGTRIGKDGGKVTEITSNGVAIEVRLRDPTGEVKIERHLLKLD